MPRRTRVLVAISLGFALAASNVSSAVKPRSISTSRQFVVYGSAVGRRGAICQLAEKTKAHLLELLQLRDNWRTPLVVNLDDPQANFPEVSALPLQVSQLGYGLKLQLNLVITSYLQPSEVQRELLRAILIEFIYRDRDVPAGATYVSPPDWLLDGILALQPGPERDERAQLLRAFLTRNRIASLGEVVREKRDYLDEPSRKIHEAYSEALLQLLLDAPDGHRKLALYIRDLPFADNDALAELRGHFPKVMARSPDKWWALAVAHLSASDRYELLSAVATSAQLDQLLHFSITPPDGPPKQYSLGDYAQFRRIPAHRAALERLRQQLRVLATRSHPLYQQLVLEQYSIVIQLLRGKTRGISAQLDRIASSRAATERQAKAIDDYLNWYEATQLKSLSGAFTPVLKAAADEKPLRRRDPISVYLDSLELEGDFQ